MATAKGTQIIREEIFAMIYCMPLTTSPTQCRLLSTNSPQVKRCCLSLVFSLNQFLQFPKQKAVAIGAVGSSQTKGSGLEGFEAFGLSYTH
jgi:hypothetical protein